MPKVSEQDAPAEYGVEIQEVKAARMPALRAKVVYLGSMTNRCLPLKGRVVEETMQGDDGPSVTKTPQSETGNTIYDFSTVGADKRPVPKDRFMPANHPNTAVRNKRWLWCEHPDHLWQFNRMRDKNDAQEFKVLAMTPRDAELLKDYFERRGRRDKSERSLFQQVTQAQAS